MQMEKAGIKLNKKNVNTDCLSNNSRCLSSLWFWENYKSMHVTMEKWAQCLDIHACLWWLSKVVHLRYQTILSKLDLVKLVTFFITTETAKSIISRDGDKD